MKTTTIVGVLVVACLASALAVFGRAHKSDAPAVDSAATADGDSPRGNMLLHFRLGDRSSYSALCVGGEFRIVEHNEDEQNVDRQEGRLRTARHVQRHADLIEHLEISGTLEPVAGSEHLLLTCQARLETNRQHEEVTDEADDPKGEGEQHRRAIGDFQIEGTVRVRVGESHVLGKLGTTPLTVTVVNAKPGGFTGGAYQHVFASPQQMLEEHWRKKISCALSFVSGAVVSVHVELYYPDPWDSDASNAALRAASADRVTVSIAVPMSYFEKAWRAGKSRRVGEDANRSTPENFEGCVIGECEKVRWHVVQIIPLPDGIKEVTELVTITPFHEVD
jgi:hypothetical protein